MFERHFKEHPHSVGETYLEHMRSAGCFAGAMFVASMACLVHAIFPSLFEKAGSSMILRLHDRMIVNRSRRAGSAGALPHST